VSDADGQHHELRVDDLIHHPISPNAEAAETGELTFQRCPGGGFTLKGPSAARRRDRSIMLMLI